MLLIIKYPSSFLISIKLLSTADKFPLSYLPCMIDGRVTYKFMTHLSFICNIAAVMSIAIKMAKHHSPNCLYYLISFVRYVLFSFLIPKLLGSKVTVFSIWSGWNQWLMIEEKATFSFSVWFTDSSWCINQSLSHCQKSCIALPFSTDICCLLTLDPLTL